MKKIVINSCYGGFGLSLLGMKRLAELRGEEVYFYKKTIYKSKDGFKAKYSIVKDIDSESLYVYAVNKYLGETFNEFPDDDNLFFDDCEDERDDANLIKVVEELGEKANGTYASLKIVEIPDDVEWEIQEYNGSEWVEGGDKIWW